MTKKFFLLTLLVLVNFHLNAQNSNWSLGFNANPFFMGALNSEQDQNVISDGISGGYGIGLSVKYNISDPIQLEGGVIYSDQTYNGEQLCCVEEGSEYRIEVSYVKFPLIVNYRWNLDYRNDTSMSIGIGAQLLTLNDSYLKMEDRLQIVTIKNGSRSLYIKDEGVVKSVIEDDFFSKNRFGLVGQFGLEKQISNSFTFIIKLKTEYDTSILDDDNGFNYDLSYFRIGLQFGIQYHFKKTRNSYVKGIL